MTTVATAASVKFGPNGVAGVDSFVRLTGRTFIYCHTYDDAAPILAIDDTHVKVSLTVPESARVTEQDVSCARQLAEAVARYVTELEERATTAGDSTFGPAAAGSEEAAGQAA